MTRIVWLDPLDPRQPFPACDKALIEPNGLLAAGGCLTPRRLIQAYSQGIFPWYDEDTPILWWSPTPRTILFPDHLKLSRSLRKTLRKHAFQMSLDQAFVTVIEHCGAPRRHSHDTWITADMRTAYTELHRLGFAHSVEAWSPSGELVGGLYGVALGRMFFGESMFSRVSDASKAALACLCAHLGRWRFIAIDCQLPTAHLHKLGAIDLPRKEFLKLLPACRQAAAVGSHWPYQADWLEVYGL